MGVGENNTREDCDENPTVVQDCECACRLSDASTIGVANWNGRPIFRLEIWLFDVMLERFKSMLLF